MDRSFPARFAGFNSGGGLVPGDMGDFHDSSVDLPDPMGELPHATVDPNAGVVDLHGATGDVPDGAGEVRDSVVGDNKECL